MSGRSPRSGLAAGRLAVPLALVAVYALAGLAWAITNPPFAAPDETQHYLRALGIRTDARLAGPRVPYTGPVRTPDGRWVAPDPSIPDTKGTIWRRKLTRGATVPAGMSPDGLDCMTGRENVTPNCGAGVVPNRRSYLADTDVGSYPPLPYLLPAAATALGDGPRAADRGGRVAMLLMWLALLAVAAAMLWDRRAGPLSLAGLVVAITPAAVFASASLGNSGFEIAATLAFFATLLRLARSGEPTARDWALAGVTGALLLLSRSLSAVWVVCALAVWLVLVGPGRARELVWKSRRAATGAALAAAAALGLALAWELAYGPHAGVTLVPSAGSLRDGVSQVRGAADEVIASFGYGDVPFPRLGTAIWALAGIVLAGAALRLGDRRERRALVVGAVLALAVPVYLYAAITSNQGIETQGRHLLPLAVMLPLLSGEILCRAVARGRSHAVLPLIFPALCVAAALLQAVAWWANSHRYAVGADGPTWFLGSSRWEPPGGWVPWAVLVATLAVAVVVAALRPLADGVTLRRAQAGGSRAGA